ncbi:MAG: hypothetical protein HZC44_04385 [Geobacter sp.]|nr:hypothetical protein [Geobacter sp.]
MITGRYQFHSLPAEKGVPGIAFTDKPAMIIKLAELLLPGLNENTRQHGAVLCGMPLPGNRGHVADKTEMRIDFPGYDTGSQNMKEEVVDG